MDPYISIGIAKGILKDNLLWPLLRKPNIPHCDRDYIIPPSFPLSKTNSLVIKYDWLDSDRLHIAH